MATKSPAQTINPIDLRPFMLRRAHLRLLVAAMEEVQDFLGDPSVLSAAGRFYDRSFRNKMELSRYLSSNDGHSQFYPWLLWDARLPRRKLGQRLLDGSVRAGGCDGQIADALLMTRADVYQVTRCDADVARLERVADGKIVTVQEPVLGTVSAPGELLVARILDLDGIFLLDAVHACLPAQARLGMLRASRKARRLPVERQLPSLLAASSRAMRRVSAGQPNLHAPDGGDIVHTTLVFDVADAAPVDRRLSEAVESGLLRRRGDGWVIADDVSGLAGVSLRLGGGRLYASTGCAQRAEALRERVAAWLPGVRYRVCVHRDLDGLLVADPWDESDVDEVRTLAERWLQEYLTAFSDRPQRTLGWITPREAVRTARGRTKVRELLRSVQRFSDAVGAGCEGAVESILSELAC